MLEFLHNLIFGNPIIADSILALGPLAIAGIGAGLNALGGMIAGKSNKRVSQDTPDELLGLIDDLEDPNYFLDQINRMFNDDATAYQIDAQLASQGVNAPAFAREQLQAQLRRQGEQKTQALGNMEGLRLRGLQNAIGQLNSINANNAGLEQEFINNRLGIINSAVGGAGSSIVQGLGEQSRRNWLESFSSSNPGMALNVGQTGGGGFDIMGQTGMAGLPG